MKYLVIFLLIVCSFTIQAQSGHDGLSREIKKAYKRTEKFLNKSIHGSYHYAPPRRSTIDTIFLLNDTVFLKKWN